jgi:hypothetical protein
MVTVNFVNFFRYQSFFDLMKQVYSVIAPPTYLYTSPLFDTWEATREELNESSIIPDVDDQPGTEDPVELEAEDDDEEEQHHDVEHPQLQQQQDQDPVPEVQQHEESQQHEVAEPQQQQPTPQDEVFVTFRRKRKAPDRYTPSKPSGTNLSPVAGPSTAVTPPPRAKPAKTKKTTAIRPPPSPAVAGPSTLSPQPRALQKKTTAPTKKQKYKPLSPYQCPGGWKKLKIPLPPGLSSDSDFE